MLGYIVERRKKGSNLWVPVNKDPIQGEVLGREAQEDQGRLCWADLCISAGLNVFHSPTPLGVFMASHNPLFMSSHSMVSHLMDPLPHDPSYSHFRHQVHCGRSPGGHRI